MTLLNIDNLESEKMDLSLLWPGYIYAEAYMEAYNLIHIFIYIEILK